MKVKSDKYKERLNRNREKSKWKESTDKNREILPRNNVEIEWEWKESEERKYTHKIETKVDAKERSDKSHKVKKE